MESSITREKSISKTEKDAALSEKFDTLAIVSILTSLFKSTLTFSILLNFS